MSDEVMNEFGILGRVRSMQRFDSSAFESAEKRYLRPAGNSPWNNVRPRPLNPVLARLPIQNAVGVSAEVQNGRARPRVSWWP